MIFSGTEQECAEIIAQLDAAHGYPRGYTQADLDSGVISRVGGGIHVPLDQIRTETTAQPQAVRVDDDGRPIGDERVAYLPQLADEHRETVGRARVLQVLNRGSREALVALPGIGPARADALIARREQGRLTRLEDVRDVLPASTVQALREHALTKAGDEDGGQGRRWKGQDVKKLLPILLVALTACAPPWQGSPIEPSSPEWVWLSEVDDLAADWRADPALPSIDTPRCAEQLADLEVRTATEREWVEQLGMCPRMPDGCMKGCGSGTCATGTVNWTTGPPRIYLSPGESADGHGITVRHETAHVLSWCVGRGIDYGHAHADVWGPQGVVWRRP